MLKESSGSDKSQIKFYVRIILVSRFIRVHSRSFRVNLRFFFSVWLLVFGLWSLVSGFWFPNRSAPVSPLNYLASLHPKLPSVRFPPNPPRVPPHRNPGGQPPRCPRAHLARPAQTIRGVDGRGLDGLHGRQSPLDFFRELLRVPAVRIHAGVGS